MSTQLSETTPDHASIPTRGGIDVFDSLLVHQGIREGQIKAVRDLVAAWASDREGDVRTLLPVDGVTLVTLFLDSDAAELVWYVEVADDDAEDWADPDATVRAASPLYSAGLDELLDGTATVHADGVDGHQLITHATHPRRQQRYADHCDDTFLAPVAGDSVPFALALVRIPLKPGPVSWLVSRAVTVGNWLKRFDRVAAWLRDQTDTLEAEAMYTESLLIEPVDDRQVLHYYIETEDMHRLYDAYAASSNWEVRFSDWTMRRIFEDPEKMLEFPLESDCETLVHAVDLDRP